MEIETIRGCEVIEKARSKDLRFSHVVLCKAPGPASAGECFVIWALTDGNAAVLANYTSSEEEARAAFNGRAVS